MEENITNKIDDTEVTINEEITSDELSDLGGSTVTSIDPSVSEEVVSEVPTEGYCESDNTDENIITTTEDVTDFDGTCSDIDDEFRVVDINDDGVMVDIGSESSVTHVNEELTNDNISLNTQDNTDEALLLHDKVMRYADRLNEIIEKGGDNLVMKVSVSDSKDNVYVGSIDQEDNSIVLIKKGAESFMMKLDGYKDIKNIFVDDDIVIVIVFNHNNQTVIVKLNDKLDVISQKVIFNQYIEVSAFIKWGDNYLIATNVIKTIDETNVFRQAIIRCDDQFTPLDIIDFDDKSIDDFNIPAFGSFSKIESMLPIGDKLFVASIFGNNEKIVSNICVINSNYEVERSSYLDIEGSDMTKIGLIHPSSNDTINVVGIYKKGSDTVSFIKKIDYELNII